MKVVELWQIHSVANPFCEVSAAVGWMFCFDSFRCCCRILLGELRAPYMGISNIAGVRHDKCCFTEQRQSARETASKLTRPDSLLRKAVRCHFCPNAYTAREEQGALGRVLRSLSGLILAICLNDLRCHSGRLQTCKPELVQDTILCFGTRSSLRGPFDFETANSASDTTGASLPRQGRIKTPERSGQGDLPQKHHRPLRF